MRSLLAHLQQDEGVEELHPLTSACIQDLEESLCVIAESSSAVNTNRLFPVIHQAAV
jgi:hypothetical protein